MLAKHRFGGITRTIAPGRYFVQSTRRAISQPLIPFDGKAPLTVTQPPHPTWKLGDGVPASEEQWIKEGSSGRKTWALESTPPRDTYQLLTSAIIPRPIAFVSSLSADGVPNLAPFSYFSMVSHNPPLVSISFLLSRARPKDSRENILSTKEFTVNIISESFIEAANAASSETPADIDEWILSGLTMEPSIDVKPSFVNESSVSFECQLYSSQDIATPHSSRITTTVILGLIKRVHIRESVLHEDGNTVDPGKLRPLARLGGNTYSRLLDVFDLPRVPWNGSTQGEYEDLRQRKDK